MGEINAALGASGAGQKAESLGVEWTFAPITAEIEAAYESRIEMRARKKALAAKKGLSPEEYVENLSAVNSDIAIGVYSFNGNACRLSLSTNEGYAYLVSLMLKVNHQDVTPEKADEIIKGNPDGVMSIVRANLGLDHPNGQAGTAKT